MRRLPSPPLIASKRAVNIAETEARVIAKVEFSKIAVQMLLVTMLINAAHAALEDREEALRPNWCSRRREHIRRASA